MAPSPARDIAAGLRASLAESDAAIERLAGQVGAFSHLVAEFRSTHLALPSAEAPADETAPPSSAAD